MPRKTFLNISLLIVVAILASGCAINRATANVEPTTDLNGIKSMYVTKLAPDERGINILIADKLKQMVQLKFVADGKKMKLCRWCNSCPT